MAGKARDIRTFFRTAPPRKPVAAPSPSLPVQPSYESSALSPPPLDPTPPALSSRAGQDASSTPSPPPSRPREQAPRPRDAVIQASDDEGSSDDSLEDVDAIWRRANPERAAVAAGGRGSGGGGGDGRSKDKDKDGPATPRAAKRTAVASTPLTIRAKRLQQAHKYDMSALLRLNQADLDAEASGQRVEALLSDRGRVGGTVVVGGTGRRRGDGSSPFSSPSNRANNAHDDDSEEALVRNLEEYIPDNDDDEAGGGNGNGAATGKAKGKAKLKQAIRRTEATDVGRRCFYFFGRDSDPVVGAKQTRPLFPKHCATGRWRLLKAVGTRDQHFLAGLPEQLVRRGAQLQPQQQQQPLPDEVFLWILRQVPLEQDRRLREQYILTASAAIGASSELGDDAIGDRVDQALLFELFQSLGCKRQGLGDGIAAELPLEEEVADYYAGRDWSNLVSVLELIAALCRAGCSGKVHPLPLSTVTAATQLLLQLGLDTVVVENVTVVVGYRAALEALVESVTEGDWNSFCYDVAKCFHSNVKPSHLRWQAIGSIGPDTGQRWLLDLKRRLAAVCFFDDPEHARRGPDRAIGLQALVDRLGSGVFLVNHETDYRELAGMLRLLDVTLADGLDRAVGDLDARLDRLCHQVELIWRKIYATGAGQSSRLDSKTLAAWIRDRIKYTVRTRPPPKTSIYDGALLRDDDAGAGLKHQDIRNMFQAKIMAAASKRDDSTIYVRTS
ncbi:hypothetical protein GGTG_11632 [Gaeumannomyces tritici R3-111a-1]|uniref:Uncharacterized protein n=1 Tax=Gaeumannomyces tritici (strain R3-111a-1) TaxID=644352 RepID=J3PDQ9_GAET3|nr:hypothetical protein GGTG_11632 [Gaeumannomyces tritici R3-111a-1]EJT70609.1 hypothetical protein GGTG_11632 [Gaeumannomyces tritici R3-111a-1]